MELAGSIFGKVEVGFHIMKEGVVSFLRGYNGYGAGALYAA